MADLSRRTFLASTGAVALTTMGAAAAEASGTITDVRHIVVLMQENRSFDHYFGTLKGVRGFADRSTIVLNGGLPVFNQPNGGGRQYPFPLRGMASNAETLAQCQGDIAHSWSDQHAAWNKGKMDSWMSAKNKIGCLGYLDRQDLPLHYALADSYTICDAYHCAGLTATGPNRTFLFSGMIDAAGRYGSPANDGGDESGLTWQTYAEVLQNAGITWRVYQNAKDNFGDNGLAYFKNFTTAKPGSPLYDRGMASVPAKTGRTPDDILAAVRADVVAGTLPQVSWVVTDQITSEHPIGPPVNGERFVSGLLQALAADQDTFNSTVLFLNYDENDGFFDHVPPPSPAAGTADEFVNGVPVGLGFRVPMLIMSPWTRGGWVCSEVFDHTSVIRFIETWSAAVGKPARCQVISAWRRAVCGDLTSAFDFTNPVYGLPSLPTPGAVIPGSTCALLPNPAPKNNALPPQEPGTRPARPLPYQTDTSISAWTYNSDGSIQLNVTMSNSGTRAAHFSAYVNAFRTGGPWQYTVNSSTTDFFNCGPGFGDGRYDVTVVGPNRFLRRFQGNATGAAKNVETRSRIAVTSSTGKLALWLDFVNGSGAPVTFTVTSNNYRGDGPWTYTVAAGQTASDYFNAVAYFNGWYDFTVAVSTDSTWSRRFVGHIETGAPSVSG
ncbi:phosphocholine-specific phospholipase C [Actinocrispum wychmicini]|uniref:phospholipase C n=1 Tax=Actinocrispum wychmicini TaxID=1213861 RepID=A0A4R2J2R6_9PSEU|nr:phospholipase C, phosphocholine-specific [Actinocrispum wychmicini]TCO52623.1 phospholipase C [Actinocrispum wychmicini]